MSQEMTSNKPYLIRAFYDWILDNELTPYIVVDCNYPNVMVPQGYADDGQIVLNIAPASVGSISLTGEVIEFTARFGGKVEHLYVPHQAVAAIYARENGVGSSFVVDYPELADSGEEVDSEPKRPETKGKPSLSIVK
ncbi:ClpXP protease specificity-enhancing factor [Thalassotalea ponticola]|uniref:ClpXP protease specificity-enhancing factor n=1 Tax=Thalassotalea ponticola TaxID=1523392 RepID=UPI0025B4DDBD|nr:ClpXP protease specificity-enhancing factor [Thalassotalea ponticola]MDN3653539.1 ClpXP protease specificity-enhancing factor [Thalassotalea ponticola]